MPPPSRSVPVPSGAVRLQQGEVWREEAVLRPVAGKGVIEQLTQEHRADYP